MNEQQTAVARTYSRGTDALVAVMHLESAGIEASIKTDDAGGAYPALQLTGGVKVVVAASQAEAAAAVLAELDRSDDTSDEASAASGVGSSTELGLVILAAFVVGVIVAAVGLKAFGGSQESYPTVIEYDHNLDGRPDSQLSLEGRLPDKGSSDRNFDGRNDFWTYYVDGSLKRIEQDDNFDGEVDVWIVYNQNQPVSSQADMDFDGVADASYTYESGIRVRVDWHPSSTDVIERREIFRHGVKYEEFIDTDQDGSFDLKTFFDPSGKPLRTVQLGGTSH